MRVVNIDSLGRWLEIEEVGVELVVDGPPPESFKVGLPPRYGRYLIRLQAGEGATIRRAQPSNSMVSIAPRLLCSTTEELAHYQVAAALANELVPIAGPRSVSERQADIEQLARDVKSPKLRALSKHLLAQNWFSAGQAAQAASAFADAEVAWLSAHDPARAMAARVGRVEDLIRAAEYDQALTLIPDTAVERDTAPYFSNRLYSARCQILRYRGRLQEALPCYDASIAWLRDAGEDTERASMLIDQVDVLRRLGQGSIAEERTAEARAIAVGPYAPLVRGRAELMLYDLLLDRGDVVGAIDRIQAALGEFSTMREARWQANAMLRAAWLYAQLGAIGEARSLIDSARDLLNEKDAPARIAAAWMLSAEAELQDGDPGSALLAARKAEEIYAHLGMAVELDDCRAMIAALLLDAGEPARAAAVLRDRDPDMQRKTSWVLVEAGVSLAQGQLARTRKLLSSTNLRQGQRFADDIRVVVLKARLLAAEGNRDGALASLGAAAKSISEAAGAVDNGVLASLLRRGSIPLRRVAFELLLQEASGSRTPLDGRRMAAMAWDWLAMAADRTLANRTSESEAASVRFDEGLARQLLLDPSRSRAPAAPAAARSLLQTLTARGHAEAHVRAHPRAPTLEQFQAEMPQDALFVAHLDAGKHGGMLWIGREHAWVVAAPGAHELRKANVALLARLERPDATLAEVDAAAGTLARMVFDSAPASGPPSRLLIALDGELSAVPWAVLRWSPGADQLVATATTSFVHMHNDCCEPLAESRRVRVIVAPQSEAGAGLAPLPVAASEMHLVRGALETAGFGVEPVIADDRESIFRALAVPGEWVHIAAHGQTIAGRLGRSGIWIERGKTDGPQFLSGIGMLGRDVRSELVVMDGCELDASGDGGAGSLNFANAAAKAGARNVVAAMWPVSDSAAATWVPAFYRAALDSSEPRFARALQQAQLQLRASRRYRHPYYWASLRHTEVIGIGATVSNGRVAQR